MFAYSLQMDAAINFGFVPAVESHSQQFVVVNSGDTLVSIPGGAGTFPADLNRNCKRQSVKFAATLLWNHRQV